LYVKQHKQKNYDSMHQQDVPLYFTANLQTHVTTAT